jgi:hypothetical protein
MKGLIIRGGWWWRLVHPAYTGMALFPFILLRNQGLNARLLRHERIHLRQQAELLVLPFYLWYLLEYLAHRVRGKGHAEAYRRISFEREAFANDDKARYLDDRPFWAFRHYLAR